MSMELRLEAHRREEERQRLHRRDAAFTRDLLALAGRRDGRRLLRWLLDQGDLFNPDWLPGAAGAYQAGRRATALRLWRVLRERLDPAAFAAIALDEDEETE